MGSQFFISDLVAILTLTPRPSKPNQFVCCLKYIINHCVLRYLANSTHVQIRDVKSSRPTRPRGQFFWPRPWPCVTLASFSLRLASWPRGESSKSGHEWIATICNSICLQVVVSIAIVVSKLSDIRECYGIDTIIWHYHDYYCNISW